MMTHWRNLDCPVDAPETDGAWLASMVHDLRQPLCVLRVVSAGMEEEQDELQREEDVRALRAGLEYLTELVDELQDGHVLSTQDIEPKPAEFDVSALVAEVVETFQPRARLLDKRLGAVLPGIQVRAHTDRSLLKRIVCNLVDNGLRHGRRRGRVTVWLSVEGRALRIRVEDDGPGLPADFAITAQGAPRKRGGRGVGLMFCAKACRALGGALSTLAEEGVSQMLVEVPDVVEDR